MNRTPASSLEVFIVKGSEKNGKACFSFFGSRKALVKAGAALKDWFPIKRNWNRSHEGWSIVRSGRGWQVIRRLPISHPLYLAI